jgi:acetyl-CoA synthetase
MSEVTIESVLQEQRLFAPPETLAAQARIGSMEAYRALAAKAEADPDAFWGEFARSELHWFEPFHTVLDWSQPPSPAGLKGAPRTCRSIAWTAIWRGQKRTRPR